MSNATDLQTLRHFNEYNTTVSRRDKWFRLVQYSSKLILQSALKRGLDKEGWVQQLRGLEGTVSTGRKMLRIVGSSDFALKALNAWRDKEQDTFLRYCQTISMGMRALWLLNDHMIFLTKASVLKMNVEKLGRRSGWCWMVALIAAIIKDFRLLYLLELRILKIKQFPSLVSSAGESTTDEISRLRKEQKAANVDLCKDLLDLCIPLGGLGCINAQLSSFAGVISTIHSLKTEWFKVGRTLSG